MVYHTFEPLGLIYFSWSWPGVLVPWIRGLWGTSRNCFTIEALHNPVIQIDWDRDPTVALPGPKHQSFQLQGSFARGLSAKTCFHFDFWWSESVADFAATNGGHWSPSSSLTGAPTGPPTWASLYPGSWSTLYDDRSLWIWWCPSYAKLFKYPGCATFHRSCKSASWYNWPFSLESGKLKDHWESHCICLLFLNHRLSFTT